MAKIRHIVYRAADLEGMASFFVNAFDLSDGTIHFAVLPPHEEGDPLGFEHIRVMVEDEEEACRRLEAAGARETGRTVDPYQIKFQGPEGIMVEIGN